MWNSTGSLGSAYPATALDTTIVYDAHGKIIVLLAGAALHAQNAGRHPLGEVDVLGSRPPDAPVKFGDCGCRR